MNDIKGKAIANLAQKLLNMKKLRHLKVCLSSNFIETQGGTELAKALIQMNNLLSLDLKVNRAFGYNGFAPIVEAIGKLSNLKSLVFHAGINKVGIKGA
jgi:Ran GTPase-activating protein (RanGAP) involved in mRNA processing and transport